MVKSGKLWDMEKTDQFGAAQLRLDERGRLAVPKNLRTLLCGREAFILTAHPHGCLSVYDEARFDEIRRQITERPNTAYFDSHLEELILGFAEPLQIDAVGRFLIGGHLRTYARIERDLRLFRLPGSVRIWSEERWAQRQALMTARLQDEKFSATWQDLRL